MPRNKKQPQALLTMLLAAVTLASTGCGGQNTQSEQTRTPVESPMTFEHTVSNVQSAQREELCKAIEEAEKSVQQAVARTRMMHIKNQPVSTYADFASKRELYEYYTRHWSEQLATQLTHETIDLNYSIPGHGLAVNSTFRQVSPLSMRLPQARVTSYYKNTAIVEYVGKMENNQTYRIQYTLMKSNENDRWLVAHKAISRGGVGPHIGNKKGR